MTLTLWTWFYSKLRPNFPGDRYSGSFEQSLQSITSEYQMKATILRQGGSGAVLGSVTVTPEELVKEALLFPQRVRGDEGYPYIALAIPYNHIEHPVASPFDLSHQIATLERLGELRDRFLKYQNDLQFALDHQDQFLGIDTSKVGNRYNEISEEISNVVKAARSCFIDLTKCDIPSVNLSLLENILPSQTVTPPPPPPVVLIKEVEVIKVVEKLIPPKIHKLGILYNYGNANTSLFVFPPGRSSYQLIWNSGPGKFVWENAKLAYADIRDVGESELCVLYNYGNANTSLFVFPADGSSYQLIWNSGPGKFVWENAKLTSADIRGVGKSELCILYNYGGANTSLFVFPAGGSGLQLIWNSGPGNFIWEASSL